MAAVHAFAGRAVRGSLSRGDGRERSRRFTTKRDAQTFLANTLIERRISAPGVTHVARMLLADWVEQWRATVVDLRASARARDDSYLRNHVLPQFGGLGLAPSRPSTSGIGSRSCPTAGSRPATCTRRTRRSRRSCERRSTPTCSRQSPCRRVPLPRIEREEMRFLDARTRSSRSPSAISPRYRALVIFDAYCGLRLSELAGLAPAHRSRPRRGARSRERGRGAGRDRVGRAQDPRRPPHGADPDGCRATVRRTWRPTSTTIREALVFGGAERRHAARRAVASRFWHPAVERAGLDRCGRTICATPRSRSGSRRAPTPSRTRRGPATRACRSCSTATGTSSRVTRSTCWLVSMRSSSPLPCRQ